MSKILISIMVLVFGLALLLPAAIAQDDSQVILEEITAEDLGLTEEPTVLPTSPVGYFFKNIGRSLQTAFTFNSVKKAELQLKQANERILEAKIVAEREGDNAKTQEVVAKALEKIESLKDKVSQRIEKIQENDSQSADRLLDLVTDREVKHQQLIDNITVKMENLSEERKVRIEEVKERTLEKYSNLLERVDVDGEKIRERLEKVLDRNQDKIDNLKAIPVLERLTDKIQSADIKESLTEAKVNITDRVIEFIQVDPNFEKNDDFEQKLRSMQSVSDQDEGYNLRALNLVKERLEEKVQTAPALRAINTNIERLKEERLQYFKGKLEEAGSDDDRAELLKPLEEGEVGSVEVLEEIRARVQDSNLVEDLKERQEVQIRKLNDRVENLQDGAKAETLRQMIEAKPEVKRVINKESQILDRLKEKAAEGSAVNSSRQEVSPVRPVEKRPEGSSVVDRPASQQTRDQNQRTEQNQIRDELKEELRRDQEIEVRRENMETNAEVIRPLPDRDQNLDRQRLDN